MLASSRGVGRNVGRWYNFMMSLGIPPYRYDLWYTL